MMMEEKLEVPSPHPTDVREQTRGDEGGAVGHTPSPDAPGIELKESSNVLRNPLVGERRMSESPEEETKNESNEHDADDDTDAYGQEVENIPPEADQEQPPPLTSILVTECHTVYSVLTFAITSIYPLNATHAINHNIRDDGQYNLARTRDFWTMNLLPIYIFATMISFMLKVSN